MAGGNWKEMVLACEKGDIELVQYYLKLGVDINYLHPEFMTTPLIESVRFGHIPIARLLLENGADPKIQDSFSLETPMSIAKAKKNKKAIALLNTYLPNKD